MSIQKINKDIGTRGESYVLQRLMQKGFSLYKRNIRRWGSEIDLVLYRYIRKYNFVEIRIIEVKTRTTNVKSNLNLLDSYGIENKWLRVKRVMFDISREVKGTILSTNPSLPLKSGIHFDLVIVEYENIQNSNVFRVKAYVKDVNLFI